MSPRSSSGCHPDAHRGGRNVRKDRLRRPTLVLQGVEGLESRTLLSLGLNAPAVSEFALTPWVAPAPSAALGRIAQAEIQRVLPTLTTTGSESPIFLLQGEVVPPGPVGDFTTQTNVSGSLIKIDDFRADPRFRGIDGSGFATVIIDTGIDLDHPFFGPDLDSNGVADRIIFGYDFSGANDPDASDTHGHGSNVSSIVASADPTFTGMAPAADIIHLKVFPDGPNPLASTADIEEALQWVVANAATYNIVSVNMSLGSGNYQYAGNGSSLSDEIAALVALNIMSVVAAGNSFYSVGSTIGVSSPANDANAIAVGAVYDSNIGSVFYRNGAIAYSTGPDVITPFTQRHPDLMHIMAPGAPITGANQSGGTVALHGTSQAAPHIAGIIALAQELAVRELSRRLRLDEIRTLLATTGAIVNDGDNENDNVTNTGLNFRRVDVLALGIAILNMVPSMNSPPVLAPIADRTIPSGQDVVIEPLSATDPDGDPIRLAATAQSLAYVLDQQLGLTFTGDYSLNWGGRDEKWMQSTTGWHFILPDGELYRWDGSGTAAGTPVGTPGASYYADPPLLHDAMPDQPHAAVSVSGSTLTIDREDGFIGAVVATVTASDGRGGTDSKTFTVTVTSV